MCLLCLEPTQAGLNCLCLKLGTSPFSSGPAHSHKPLLPLDAMDAALFGMVVITLLIAAGGGIGGGALFVPLYILLGGFATSRAVALSNLTVLGGAIANFLINVFRRHPHINRPIIDWVRGMPATDAWKPPCYE